MTSETTISPEGLQAIRRRFLTVFGVLIVGTIITVALYYVHFEHVWQTVTIALVIAAIKAGFVATVFMHLSHAERVIRLLLFFTGIFFVGMLGFIIYSLFSVPGV